MDPEERVQTGPAPRAGPHSDYPAPSLKMSVKIDFIYEI